MKNKQMIFLSVIVAFILFSCEKPEYTQWRKNIPWMKDVKEGLVLTHDSAGNIAKKLHYSQGLLHGAASGYWPSGVMRWSVNYRFGKKQGEQLLFRPDGSLYTRCIFDKGKMHGVLYQYGPGGELRYKIPMNYGRISGPIVRVNWVDDHKKNIEPAKSVRTAKRQERRENYSEELTRSQLPVLDEELLPEVTGTDEAIETFRAALRDEDLETKIGTPQRQRNTEDWVRPVSRLPENTGAKEDMPSTPGKKFGDDESWKYEMLKQGKDYEAEVKKGI